MEPLAGARGHHGPVGALPGLPVAAMEPLAGARGHRELQRMGLQVYEPQWSPSPERGVTELAGDEDRRVDHAAMEPLAGARGHGGARVGLRRKGFGSLARDLP